MICSFFSTVFSQFRVVSRFWVPVELCVVDLSVNAPEMGLAMLIEQSCRKAQEMTSSFAFVALCRGGRSLLFVALLRLFGAF